MNPPAVLTFLALWIFLAEVASMLILSYSPRLSRTEESILDGIILLVLISPAYLFLYRPLKVHWDQRLRCEREIRFLGQKLLSSTEEERRRLARDLHDECGGLLNTLQLKMETLKHHLSRDPQQSREQADQVIGLLTHLGGNLRSISNRLRPVMLERFGLVATLRRLVEEYAGQWPDGEIAFEVTGIPERLRPDVELALFHICQEALSNATRHARAGRIEVRLEAEGDWAVLSVKDDGRGIAPEGMTAHGAGEGGFGLLGMRERSVLLGGTYELHSTPGAGVLVRVRLPLAGEEAR